MQHLQNEPCPTMFRINPDLDPTALAAEYAAEKHVRIHGLLNEEGVLQLHENLRDRDDWWHLIHSPAGPIEHDRPTRSQMSREQADLLDREVHERARTGFQYRYEGLRVPDEEDEEDELDPLTDFSRLMSSVPMLDLLRAITGTTELAFTDGQATAYGPGDFLTGHDDDVAGKNRLAAYVFGLTPFWRPEWGGLLLFHSDDTAAVKGHVPQFNSLDLFAVPQYHSVSLVTPAAPQPRFAVTGWLRSGQAGD